MPESPDSPATQMRLMLYDFRRGGVPFERAWRVAFNRIAWPHATTHRIEWKAVLGDEEAAGQVGMEVADAQAAVEAWKAAYDRMPEEPALAAA